MLGAWVGSSPDPSRREEVAEDRVVRRADHQREQLGGRARADRGGHHVQLLARLGARRDQRGQVDHRQHRDRRPGGRRVGAQHRAVAQPLPRGEHEEAGHQEVGGEVEVAQPQGDRGERHQGPAPRVLAPLQEGQPHQRQRPHRVGVEEHVELVGRGAGEQGAAGQAGQGGAGHPAHQQEGGVAGQREADDQEQVERDHRAEGPRDRDRQRLHQGGGVEHDRRRGVAVEVDAPGDVAARDLVPDPPERVDPAEVVAGLVGDLAAQVARHRPGVDERHRAVEREGDHVRPGRRPPTAERVRRPYRIGANRGTKKISLIATIERPIASWT